MFRPVPRRPVATFAASLAVAALSTLVPSAAVAQEPPRLPELPDGLSAPEEGPTGDARVREDGIDARRFTPDPAERPGEVRDPRSAPDPRAVPGPSNGYEYSPPSGQPVSPLLDIPSTRLVPGAGGLPGFDPDDSPVLLGVSGTDTASGVLVTNVVRGTPAERAGLERGDRILTVSGYQVGVVSTPNGPRVYPLGVELARRLSPTGDAELLVQDHRTRQITTVTVRPVSRYGPTSPPGYESGYGDPYRPRPGAGSLYGPDTGFGTGVNPLGPPRYDSGYGLDPLYRAPQPRGGIPRR
ncbi:PDZ domain-containing protein [Alienimonas chondri]|uniref:PDZ domain-containing protein n=1 Tax=Alienimonas chondri TaxID=2681879 RepID=A0ABX1VB58_9PLAN|nr:PDZ domain-containing protein [Alienimonas chondri]NNJ25117.1 hypothetical protein [Alienimonas chondri]